LTIGLMIAAMRGFSAGEKHLRDGNWRGTTMSGLVGRKVSGKTLGLVGLGRIGEKVARRARAFDMEILYFSRTRKAYLEKNLGLKFIPSLEELVAISDVVSLHTPLIHQTHHLINADILKKFKPGAFLINTGRGGLVDEAALVQALTKGPLAGAGLDVYEFEPELAEGLQALDNVTLLPHLGTATEETRTAMGLRVKENLDAYFATGQVKDRVV
jgi:lactate dehydrogenase-like 2-hydroxyacid dehydrogenase